MMIPLFVDKGVAYVWNAEDWFTLRTEHRICGALIGSLPSFPRQNDFLGLPVALMFEEATLLVKKGICELYELSNIANSPNELETQEAKAMEEKILKEQREAFRKRRIEQLSQKIDIILAGKRQKLLSKGVSDVQLNKQTLLEEEINKLPPLASVHVLVHLPMQHYIVTDKKKVDIDALNPSMSTCEQILHSAVFNNLWEQGHYITCGSKFGADYLVYPGDPVKFHAMYMVRCINNGGASLHPINLIAFGRLSVAVNKVALLAFCNKQGEVEYQTLQWHDTVS